MAAFGTAATNSVQRGWQSTRFLPYKTHRFVDREQEATESLLRSRSQEEPTMSLSSIDLTLIATQPSDEPPPAKGHIPEMLQLDPALEIRDAPVCAIVDMPTPSEDAPADDAGDEAEDDGAPAQDNRFARFG